MLDVSGPRGRIIAAALKLAADGPWKDVRLIDIAEEAGVTLADVRAEFDGKPAIISGFVRAVDDALLKHAAKPQAGDAPRDALFEVVMARFDLLSPHKAAIKSIFSDAAPDLSGLGTALSSQQWMLSAAGIDASGPQGAVRTLGLAAVYASVFRTWLEDDDPGLARTMAALDRRLRRGERNLSTFEGAVGSVMGFARRLGDVCKAVGERRSSSSAASGRDDRRPSPDPVA